MIGPMNGAKRGYLIVVEGIDGAGKSTQVRRLAETLRDAGFAVTCSREPTDGPWGRKIRASAAAERMSLDDELHAFIEDRKEHAAQVIRPALERGEIVVLDRYYFSTMAYQGARGGDVEAIRRANEAIAPKPDLVLLIDFDPAAALQRIRGSRGDVPDEFEKLDQLQAIRAIFLEQAAADPVMFRKIDGGRDPDAVFEDVKNAALRNLPSPPDETSRLTLDFSTISHEFRSVVARRRDLMLFLGSLFAAMGLFLQKILDGELPPGLKSLELSAFFVHSILVLVPTVLIALRLAKLHTGLTINGVFYRRAVQEIRDGRRRKTDVRASARLNPFGVSTALFLLASFLASGESALLALSLHRPTIQAAAIGVAVFFIMVAVLLRMHQNAAQFALSAVENCRVEPLTGEDDEEHLAGSRDDANHDLISTISFLGLMLFSSLECISGLAKVGAAQLDLASVDVQTYGPLVYNIVLLVTCVASLLIYLRLAVSIAEMSIQLDPTDTPFRAFKLTDTVLGYWIVVFFFAVAVHLAAVPQFDPGSRTPWMIDGAAVLTAVLLYPLRLGWAAAKQRSRTIA